MTYDINGSKKHIYKNLLTCKFFLRVHYPTPIFLSGNQREVRGNCIESTRTEPFIETFSQHFERFTFVIQSQNIDIKSLSSTKTGFIALRVV